MSNFFSNILIFVVASIVFVGTVSLFYITIKTFIKNTFGKPYYLKYVVKGKFKEYSEQLRNYEYFVVVDLEDGSRLKKKVNKINYRNLYVDDRGYAKFRGSALKRFIRD